MESRVIAKRVLRISLYAVLFLFLVMIGGFYFVSRVILPAEKLTPLILSIANDNLNATLNAERIDLTLWSTFPNVGLKIKNGTLISFSSRDEADSTLSQLTDSLVTFRMARADLSPFGMIFGNKLVISEFRIDTLSIFAHINDKGRTNWEIVKSDSSVDESESLLPEVDLRALRLSHSSVTLLNERDTLSVTVADVDLFLKGALTDLNSSVHTDMSVGSLRLLTPTVDFGVNNRLGLKADLETQNNFSVCRLRDAMLSIDFLTMDLNGLITKQQDRDLYDVDMEMHVLSSNLSELLKTIPPSIVNLSGYAISGEANMGGSLKGRFGEGEFPVLEFKAGIDDGKLAMDRFANIDSLDVDFSMRLDMTKRTPSFIYLDRAFVKGGDSYALLALKVDELLGNQKIDMVIKSDLDLDYFAPMLPSPDTLTVHGTIQTDLSVAFTADDLLRANYGNIEAEGHVDVANLQIAHATDSIDVKMKSVCASFETKPIRSTRGRAFLQKAMSGVLLLDSVDVVIPGRFYSTFYDSKFTISTRPSGNKKDSAAITPVTAELISKQLRLTDGDSVGLFTRNLTADISIKPSLKDVRSPQMETKMLIDTVFVRAPKYGLFVDKSVARMKAMHYEPDSLTKLRIAEIRRVRREQGDTLTGNSQTSIFGEGMLTNLYRKWNGSGEISFNRLVSRITNFPLRVESQGALLKFSTNDLNLENTHLKVGRTDALLNGKVVNLRRMVLRGGKLVAKLDLKSDSIDLKGLIPAVMSWMDSNQPSRVDYQLTPPSMEGLMEVDSVAATFLSADSEVVVDSSILMIPSFIDFELTTVAKWVGYGNGHMTNIDGEVRVKEGDIEISNLTMKADYGNANLTMLYSPLSRKRAFTGFDLNFNAVEVDKLLDLYPDIDTMVPMLRSLEGVIDCQMAATAFLDSAMNIELPSLNAACFMHGKNLVLLDGETFTEISKKLMFKNKKRNMIDSMSVELIARNNRIEIFPFLLQLDRYKFAVAGVQNLDMSFNYHVSVLKSPLPFKIGVDVTGNADKYNYKITGAKLKESAIASKRSLIDSAQVNVRRGIREQLRKERKTAVPMIQALPTNVSELVTELKSLLDSGVVVPSVEPADNVIEAETLHSIKPLSEADQAVDSLLQ